MRERSPTRPRGRANSLFVIPVVVAASLVLAGCFTGTRGHLVEASATTVVATSDPAVAAVLAKLDTESPSVYTATYTILLRYGATTSHATVSQTSPTVRSITIGTVRYLDQAGEQQTCDVTTAVCSSGLDDTKISNAVPSHDFYRVAAAAQLRQDATTMTSAGVASTREIAGRAATCVQLTFTEGTTSFCALDNGLLAYQDTPDLQIDINSISDTSDAALFSPTTIAG